MRQRGAGLTGHQDNGGGGGVGLSEAPQALAQLVVSSILGCSVDVGHGNLSQKQTKKQLHTDSESNYLTPPPTPRVGSSLRHLAVVELLDDGFALLADVADADELGLAVALEEPAAYPLNHDSGRASARHAAVLDVPEDTHGRNVFGAVVLWGAWKTQYIHFRWFFSQQQVKSDALRSKEPRIFSVKIPCGERVG